MAAAPRLERGDMSSTEVVLESMLMLHDETMISY